MSRDHKGGGRRGNSYSRKIVQRIKCKAHHSSNGQRPVKTLQVNVPDTAAISDNLHFKYACISAPKGCALWEDEGRKTNFKRQARNQITNCKETVTYRATNSRLSYTRSPQKCGIQNDIINFFFLFSVFVLYTIV